jgi:hypothetical protein
MHGKALIALKGLLWFVALSHVALGLGIMLAPGFQRFMGEMYGANVTWTLELQYLLRPMGVFMLGLGVIGIAAALDPLRYRVVIHGFVLVLLLRVAQRVVHREEIAAAFDLGIGRQMVNGAFFFLIALALLALTSVVGRGAGGGAARPRAEPTDPRPREG